MLLARRIAITSEPSHVRHFFLRTRSLCSGRAYLTWSASSISYISSMLCTHSSTRSNSHKELHNVRTRLQARSFPQSSSCTSSSSKSRSCHEHIHKYNTRQCLSSRSYMTPIALAANQSAVPPRPSRSWRRPFSSRYGVGLVTWLPVCALEHDLSSVVERRTHTHDIQVFSVVD